MMRMTLPHEKRSGPLTNIRRVKGKPGDRYEVIFLDQHGKLVVPLTEWYRLRTERGPSSTRNTYLACLLPFFSFIAEKQCRWNAPPEQLRPALLEFHRDRLGCLIRPTKDQAGVAMLPTRDTPLCNSTLRVMRAALRDFYLVMKEERLYLFPNPLSSEVLVALKHAQVQALANRGAPDRAGIREESHEQSRRRPTAFIRYSNTKAWKPSLRKELADVREGMHTVLNALIDSKDVPLREKAVLELLQNTGARLHEVVQMTVGGYRNEGIAGQAQVVNKGSYGSECKTVYFAHNPHVQQALTAYIEHVRPLHDPQRRTTFAELPDSEPLFLTVRGTPYSVKGFYYHWYKHYPPLAHQCPVRFSPHDIRHLFISEYLIKLRQLCGAGTGHFDAEQYRREREAFGIMVMGWSSARTIDIYDHSRDGEGSLHALAVLQQDFAQRRVVSEPSPLEDPAVAQESMGASDTETATLVREGEVVWLHDPETLAWIKRMQQQTDQQ
ncbi:MAG TPA: site-specific integrase [Ktedonobacteraceae bacterium]|nr:site-specific integrase [Ktedonobacteraceae bacterium]